MADSGDPRYTGRASYFDPEAHAWVLRDSPPGDGWWRSGATWKPPDVAPTWGNRLGWKLDRVTRWWHGCGSWKQAWILGGVAVVAIFVLGLFGRVAGDPTGPAPGTLSSPLPPLSAMTIGEFNRIHTGMTYTEVIQIVDVPGELVSESAVGGSSSQVYRWPGPHGGAGTVVILNGRVASKAQAGL